MIWENDNTVTHMVSNGNIIDKSDVVYLRGI